MNTDFFCANGYQVFEKVLPTQVVDGVRAFLEEEVARQLPPVCSEVGASSVDEIVSAIGRIADGGDVGKLSKSTRDTLTGHFSLEARLSRRLWDVPRDAGLRRLLESLLNTERLFMHMPPTARFVLPRNIHAGVPAHQDVSYNKHMSNFVTLWVPLVDIDDDCGGVTVYEGSGFDSEKPAENRSDRFWLEAVAASGREKHCKISRGDVLALNKWVVHRSMVNKSPRTRYSIDFRFFGGQDTSQKHYLDMQTFEVIAPQ
jgi:hypothetical protein